MKGLPWYAAKPVFYASAPPQQPPPVLDDLFPGAMRYSRRVAYLLRNSNGEHLRFDIPYTYHPQEEPTTQAEASAVARAIETIANSSRPGAGTRPFVYRGVLLELAAGNMDDPDFCHGTKVAVKQRYDYGHFDDDFGVIRVITDVLRGVRPWRPTRWPVWSKYEDDALLIARGEHGPDPSLIDAGAQAGTVAGAFIELIGCYDDGSLLARVLWTHERYAPLHDIPGFTVGEEIGLIPADGNNCVWRTEPPLPHFQLALYYDGHLEFKWHQKIHYIEPEDLNDLPQDDV